MLKPNNQICESCFVIHNKLRCAMCKHKTTEWILENFPVVMGESDCYKAKEEKKK
jgi:hypothetical protein